MSLKHFGLAELNNLELCGHHQAEAMCCSHGVGGLSCLEGDAASQTVCTQGFAFSKACSAAQHNLVTESKCFPPAEAVESEALNTSRTDCCQSQFIAEL